MSKPMTPDNQNRAALKPLVNIETGMEVAECIEAVLSHFKPENGAVSAAAYVCADELKRALASRQQGEAVAEAANLKSLIIREAFTLEHGGPNPYYECKSCGKSLPGSGEILFTHAKKCETSIENALAALPPLYTAPPALPAPALTVAHTACCIGKGGGAEGCGFESNSTQTCPKCGGMVLTYKGQLEASQMAHRALTFAYEAAAAPALSEGLTVTEAMIDAALPHVYATKSKVRPIGQFWPGSTGLESEDQNQSAYGRDRVRAALRAALRVLPAPTQPENEE